MDSEITCKNGIDTEFPVAMPFFMLRLDCI